MLPLRAPLCVFVCVCVHVHVHVSAGIEDDIKLWAPTFPDPQPIPPEAARVMERNRMQRGRRTEHIVVSPQQLARVLGARRR